MKTDLLTNHKPEDIKHIWQTYMQERGRLADLYTAEEYNLLQERAKKFTTVK